MWGSVHPSERQLKEVDKRTPLIMSWMGVYALEATITNNGLHIRISWHETKLKKLRRQTNSMTIKMQHIKEEKSQTSHSMSGAEQPTYLNTWSSWPMHQPGELYNSSTRPTILERPWLYTLKVSASRWEWINTSGRQATCNSQQTGVAASALSVDRCHHHTTSNVGGTLA